MGERYNRTVEVRSSSLLRSIPPRQSNFLTGFCMGLQRVIDKFYAIIGVSGDRRSKYRVKRLHTRGVRTLNPIPLSGAPTSFAAPLFFMLEMPLDIPVSVSIPCQCLYLVEINHYPPIHVVGVSISQMLTNRDGDMSKQFDGFEQRVPVFF